MKIRSRDWKVLGLLSGTDSFHGHPGVQEGSVTAGSHAGAPDIFLCVHIFLSGSLAHSYTHEPSPRPCGQKTQLLET